MWSFRKSYPECFPCQTQLAFNCSPCQTHHIIPQSCSHVRMSPFTEVETVSREVGVVRPAVLEKKSYNMSVCRNYVLWEELVQWSFGSTRRAYSIQRNDSVLKKGLHNHSKVFSAIIAVSVHQSFRLDLKERP